MKEETGETLAVEIVMPEPSKELAAHVTRELEWDERIDGAIFDSGPGMATQRIYRLENLSTFLGNLPNFSVDYKVMQSWAAEMLGDAALAEAIAEALTEPVADDDAEGRTALRERIAEIVRVRVEQCAAALAEEEADGRLADAAEVAT